MGYPLYMSGMFLCLFTLYSVYCLAIKIRRRSILKKNKGCLPPKRLPQIDKFFGSDVVLENLRAARNFGFLNLLTTRHAQHGLTFTTNTFFRTTINTCNPKLIQTVLSLQFDDFDMGPLRRKSAAPLLGRGIFTRDNKAWAHQRALIKPSFLRAQVTDFKIFEYHTDQLIKLIHRENCQVDLQDLFFRLVLDSNSEYMFGESVNLLSENAKASATTFHGALDYAQQGTILRLRLGNIMFAHQDPKFWKACRTVHDYAQVFVDRAIKYRKNQSLCAKEKLDLAGEEQEKYIFLNELAKDVEDPILLRDQIVNVLLAARDTTAGLLAFTFITLARHPRVWQELRKEVLEHYCEPLTYEAVMKMTYLRYVLHEILRLFPPIATNSRMANKDTVIPVGGGPDGNSPLFVAKNCLVTYSTFVMHRREEFFGSDVDDFRPERWEKLRPGWEFLPFNGGPRICPGQKLALTEASYITARLLHAFSDIEDLDGSEWREQLTLSLTLKNGVKCRLTPA